jgi:acetolactate synthase-1/2/3 large subunit
VGDGGFMFSVNELATAVKYRLGIAFLVLNDARYGAIKYLQEAMFDGRWSETDLANPDFVALAHAFGAAGERLDGIDTLGASLERAFARSGPTVIELPMGVLPPWEL